MTCACKCLVNPSTRAKKVSASMQIWQQLTLVQVVKHTAATDWLGLRWVLWGSVTMFQRLLERSQGAGTINTAYIERLNATFRSHLSLLVRRTRCPARRQQTVTERVFYWVAFTTFAPSMLRCVIVHPLWLLA